MFVQQPVCPRGKGLLSIQTGMTAWISSSCREDLHLTILHKKGRREGNAERPFSSEITKTNHPYLADT